MDKIVEKKIKKYKNYKSLVKFISKKNIFQKKSIRKIILKQNLKYFQDADDIAKRILKVAKKLNKKINLEKIADIYLWYTDLLKKEELYFEKHKDYRNKNYDKVFKEVYNKPSYMFKYAIGLGTSQLFWENHLKVFKFFRENLVKKVKKNPLIAEIGMGHGLFTAEIFRKQNKANSIMIDVSDMCLKFAKEMSIITGAKKSNIQLKKDDIQKKISIQDNSLDVLLLGEVIEHLAEGKKVMKNLSKKMKKNGICYFSTPANGPAEDHILLFTKVKQIRKFIKDCSWKIIKDSPITLGDMSIDFAEKNSKVINYCAILKKAK
jgi:2-polyprenyl-3-methyl-5-hydroxy-6-metoxy-1,4-benzoquinol methylase